MKNSVSEVWGAYLFLGRTNDVICVYPCVYLPLIVSFGNTPLPVLERPEVSGSAWLLGSLTERETNEEVSESNLIHFIKNKQVRSDSFTAKQTNKLM